METVPRDTTDAKAVAPKELCHFIGGRKVAGTSGRFGDVCNPTLGIVTAREPFATKAETEAAIADAAEAFPKWAATSPLVRARVMFRFKQLIEEHMDEIVHLVSSEHGKVASDARGSIQRGLEVVEFACGIGHLLKGEFSNNVSNGIDMYSLRQPVGVCAGITPFNFPAMVPLWMLAVAVACGNTFVLKPSERDPGCSLRLAELLLEAGAPPGVLNVVLGDREAVDTLLTDPRVAAVSFVGSTPVARHVYATASAHGKRVQAMAGAKNHMIVLPDADMDQAADALMGAAYGSAGERCMAISVVLPVGESTADALRERLVERIKTLKVGASDDAASEMGPLVTRDHLERVQGYVDVGVQEGAELVVDGRGKKPFGHDEGFFMGACLFDNVKPEMRIYQEEIFGPVLCMLRTESFDEALRLTDEHPYGNGVAIFTRDGDAARDFSTRVQAGMVGVNVPIPVPLAFYSFGGWKDSAFGDLNQHGPDGVRFYTRLKTVTQRWPTGIRKGAEFVMPTMK
ncbi:MAG: CoA-acylating methylmalonate-semialdehyde dehydrogenase [Armatimonadetes bacterium]|nr:CoA-acylating methylmalonate-semialdehyde dehydrogenase [Armatimonadota bacterium]